MNAFELIENLKQLSIEHNVPLDNIEVNFRSNLDSDVQDIEMITEDLYDSENNNKLESISLLSKCEEYV